MENGQYADGSLWFYAPNKGAPVVFAFLFAVSCGIHVYQCIRYKCWKVSGILPWAALIFVAGYGLREYGAFHYSDLNVFIASLVMLYAAPPLYELSNYFILSRILYYVPYHSPIHPGRVLTTFGALSSVVEALNGNGAAYMANSFLPESKRATGRALLKAALILQLAILACFILLASIYHRKCRRANLMPKNLSAVLTTLYISSALIGVRTLYRTVEYFTTANINYNDPNLKPGSLSPVLRYEWFFWVFEACLMVTNSFLLNARHPLRFLPRDNAIYLAEDGVTEIQGTGYADKRNFLVTIFDPFDLYGMAKGRNMNKRFWDTHEHGRVTEVESGKATASGEDAAEKGAAN